MSPLINLQNAGLSVDGKALLSNISFHSDARRIGVVGQNGSGKTSLARLISGLVAPTSGQVRLKGADVAKDRSAALGLVGIVFQNPDHQIIFPTVGEEIAFGLTQQGYVDPATAVIDILTEFGKAHWFDAPVHQLSQGQRQLVCLMAVLVMQPQLVILDEPFAGLDIPAAAHLARVLDRLAVNLMQITHDPATLAGYETVIWMDGGRIHRQGDAAPVLSAYRTEMMQRGAVYDLSDIAG